MRFGCCAKASFGQEKVFLPVIVKDHKNQPVFLYPPHLLPSQAQAAALAGYAQAQSLLSKLEDQRQFPEAREMEADPGHDQNDGQHAGEVSQCDLPDLCPGHARDDMEGLWKEHVQGQDNDRCDPEKNNQLELATAQQASALSGSHFLNGVMNGDALIWHSSFIFIPYISHT